MTVPIDEVVLAGGDSPLRARLSHGHRSDLPLLVAVHGAAYDARYFDAAHASVHERAAAAGWSMLSITRPGYPADDRSAASQPDFAGAAAILGTAIGDAWQRWGEGRPGVVLLGHSVGAAVAVHLAAQPQRWPLLGLAISGIGDRPAPGPAAVFGTMPTTIALTFEFAQCRPAFYGPDDTVHPDAFDAVESLLVPCPSADVVEVNTTWPADLERLAPQVPVPVHYVLAEHDGLWEVSYERVAAFAARFTQAPHVDVRLWSRAGHNIEHHLAGPAYVDSVLAFAARCCP